MVFTIRKLLALTLAFATWVGAIEQVALKQSERPNIVFILTDDQDLHMDSLDYMPLLKKHIIDHGTFYKSHYCSTAICCPSRVTLWTGRNAHNTNVTDVFPPYGGYPKFVAQGFNEDWLPLWLQDAGYSTYYTGKLFNSHTVENWNSPHPSGWTSSDFLLDPYTYSYLNATFQRNEHPPVSHEGEYSTDVLAGKALTDEIVSYNDEFYRARLQSLQAVDELVEGVISRLDGYGILDNTYVIYTTDNGYHISQHRLAPGKECGFEEDINIPLVIRGPGVPIGEADIVSAHTDLAPTILKLAGGDYKKPDLDGSPIPLNKKDITRAKIERQEHVNVEFWGRSLPEGIYKFSLDDGKIVAYGSNNTYKALRVVGKEYNIYYSVWCTNEHELYDLTADPHQINNIHPSISSSSELPKIFRLPPSKVLPRLDALLMVTKSCRGATCVDPWSVLHPRGDIKTLADAMRVEFDDFYASTAEKVSFDKCELGYILESEGPQALVNFDEWKEEDL
ncbi:Arylsulfatase [Hyphodiscus hymeniophilus]|uniref:Arylsulfatase n=1 Tax=Hyphodiscus hymeniophilus TaxID=353542 RepID=A0A9P6VDU1_9HELO|nr:Arylsulfatase [Hyphodiscus hymeniophilus]